MWFSAKVISRPSAVTRRSEKIAPALLISASTRASPAAISPPTRRASATSDKSAIWALCPRPGATASSLASVASARLASRAMKTMRAPIRASSTTAIAPIPDVAPVATTVLPCIDALLDRFRPRSLPCLDALLVVLHVGEDDFRPSLLVVAQIERAGGEEHRRAVEVGGDRRRIGGDELVELGLVVGADPAAHFETALLERDRQAVFGFEALGEHVELQRPDHADHRARSVVRHEHLHHAFLGHLLQRL